MHAAGVTHRDIKLENIFSDAASHPKLGDFDLAVFHHEAPTRAPVGTIFYMAPEVLLLASARGSGLEVAMQRRVNEKMDVWSLGVCLFELAAGADRFRGFGGFVAKGLRLCRSVSWGQVLAAGIGTHACTHTCICTCHASNLFGSVLCVADGLC
jgi:serine/threonine protein kinase